MNYLARPYPVTIPHGLRRWLSGKKICANAEAAGDACSIPVSARSPGKAMATHACLENHHGQRSLAGYSPRGHEELDLTWRRNHHSLYGGSG